MHCYPLQALPTKDGWKYLKEATDTDANRDELIAKHMSAREFRDKFYDSQRGIALKESLDAPVGGETHGLRALGTKRYKNSTFEGLKLVVQREVLLWWRDKYQIGAKVAQGKLLPTLTGQRDNLVGDLTFFTPGCIMGVVSGTVFFQSSDNPQNIVSVLFQSMFFGVVGAMVSVVRQFPERSIFYKHQDANFFPTWTFVIGRSIATIPSACFDAVLYGTLLYYLVDLAHDDGASIGNYFIFMILMFSISLSSGLFFGVFSASVQTLTMAQACMALSAMVFVLFSGFTVQPNIIPPYYIWIYWVNFFAWGLRGFIVNEFDSGRWSAIVPGTGMTVGEVLLTRFGFVDRDDEPFTSEWVWWGVLVIVGASMISVFATGYFLENLRFATGRSLVTDQGEDKPEDAVEGEAVSIPFKRVDLTFQDVHYTVTASTSNEKLELLKGVDGVIAAGMMTALMGSSGAGKTTLMDVLALRKNSGEITGDVRLNGHRQEEESFRRCTGYVEQFDVQTPQLTIRETIEFSARLRLDESDESVTPESRKAFVEQTLQILELSNIQDLQVGSDETGGLSFEQKKRLSIAVELVANPSILFLDEVSLCDLEHFESYSFFRLLTMVRPADEWIRCPSGCHCHERLEAHRSFWESRMCHDPSAFHRYIQPV